MRILHRDATSFLQLSETRRALCPTTLVAVALLAGGCPPAPGETTEMDSDVPNSTGGSGGDTITGGSAAGDSDDQPTGVGSTSGTTETSEDPTAGTTETGAMSTGDSADVTSNGSTDTGASTTDDTTTGVDTPPGCESRPFEADALTMLDFTIKDAEYSKQLDRVVAVSHDPPALHLYDPWTGNTESVSLPLAASSVSVGPGGMFAAVGHDGWVSYVDLVKRTLVTTHPVTADVLDVVLADNGYIYAFPRQDQWEQIYTIEIATGAQTQSGDWAIYAGTVAKMHPDGDFLYGADNGLSPSDIEKYDIQGGTATYLYDSPYHGDYGMCGDLWMSEDGKRIFTRCGNVFFASTDKAKDMTYNGSFPDEIDQIEHLSHSAAAGQVALIGTAWAFPGDPVVEDTEVHLFNYDFLTPAGTQPLPTVEAQGMQFPMHGRFVFHDCLGESVFVVAQADPEASFLNDYGIIHL